METKEQLSKFALETKSAPWYIKRWYSYKNQSEGDYDVDPKSIKQDNYIM